MKQFTQVAIIGYGCVYPDNIHNTDKLWDMIIKGDNHIDVIPKERWDWELYYSEDRKAEDKTYSKIGACITDYEFNKKYFEKYKDILSRLNRSQVITLDSILQSVEKTKYTIKDLKEKNVGYLMGNMLGDDLYPDLSLRYHSKEILEYMNENDEYSKLDRQTKKQIESKLIKSIDKRFKEFDSLEPEKFINSALGFYLKEVLGLKGTSAIIDGACSSGLLVIDEAISLLNSKENDMFIVTGLLGSVNVIGSVGFSKIGGLSNVPNRPLDKSASGLNSSEGVGTIIIKRLSDAIRDGDKIYSVISGVGSANDGKGKSIYAPSRYGQCKAMKKAIDRAGIKPKDLDYIEVHATGTPTGDIEEIETLKLLFKDEGLEKQTVPIGSIKSQIGHSFSAAGMANLFKVMESMKHKVIPPTWNYNESPKEVNLQDSMFYVNTKEKEWIPKKGQPMRAAINAFGFGGINSSLIIEEYIEDYHKKKLQNVKEEYIDFSDIDIAVVGIGVLDSRSDNLDEWLKNYNKPMNTSRYYPKKRWSSKYSEIFSDVFDEGCFIEDYKFPWLKFKLPPKVIEHLDRSQPISLMVSNEAISDYGEDKLKGAKTSVHVAKIANSELAAITNTSVRYIEYITRLQEIDEFKNLDSKIQSSIISSIKSSIREYAPIVTEDTLPGYMDNIVSGRISNHYDFSGTSYVVDAGSNSFIVALRQGIYKLMVGESDYALVGGIHANMSPEFLKSFNDYFVKYNIEQCEVPSEGCVFFLLKKFEDVSQTDKVYFRIKSIVDEGIDNSIYSNYTEVKNNYILSEKNERINYFAAQIAFEMLNAMPKLEKGIVKIKDDCCYLGNEYSVYIAPADCNSKVLRNNFLDINTIYIQGNNWQEIIDNCLQINEVNFKEYLNRKQDKKEYEISITFSSIDDLKRKLRMIK